MPHLAEAGYTPHQIFLEPPLAFSFLVAFNGLRPLSAPRSTRLFEIRSLVRLSDLSRTIEAIAKLFSLSS
jgi:hypothetical protein